MFVITNANNVVIAYGRMLEYKSNGYPWLVNEDISFVPEQVAVHEIESMPQGIAEIKFCYTAESGFYENPDWKEPTDNPYNLTDEQYRVIKDRVIDEIRQEVANVD
ncbi:hypothetical protein ACPW7J_13755 [Ihubacter sp. rT4E-8]|uniref:hypothetical protein n=1 Tax=Ihubacter sp. rT4E-8 TaxID=3242369 RepID=UPI003CEE11E6